MQQKKILFSLIPVMVILSVVVTIRFVYSENDFRYLFGLVLITFLAGKFVILIPLMQSMPMFSPMCIAAMVVVIESCIAFFLLINLEFLFKLPWVGVGLKNMEDNGRATLSQHHWIRRMTIFGVILFVILPLPGTGSIGGIIVSRLVGLSRSMSFIAVFIGTAIGTYAMAIGASTLIDMFSPIRDSAWFGVLRFSVLGLIVFLLSQLGRRKISGNYKDL
ncbi:MAG: small multi-drug export protein [Thermodesulfobacteriota bacterium]|nr:small multi-drug export protein [Thermodesulfobacteriota bacterium]